MKYITKDGTEPDEFTAWKNQKTEDWIPSFDKLSGDSKKSVTDALKVEQGYICCYCERNLEENDCHIEHLNPQHLNVVDPLDFSNMLCSCQMNLIKGEPRHCGNSKDNWYDANLLVSPLNPKCESKFKYTFDGHIEPLLASDNSAITTIAKLNLDDDKLIDFRNKAITPFLDGFLTPAEVKKFAKGYLVNKENNGGRFNEFYTTIKYLFG